MSNDQGGGFATAGHDSSQTDSLQKNPLSDVQNWLGFLLAGFGAILSFLGLRSTEVTTVLRNDPAQASLIALMLLLGVLTAVLIVAIDNADAKKVSWTSAAGLVVVLLGIGAFVIYAIPVGASVGLLSLVLGSILVPLGIIILLIGTVTPRKVIGGVGAVLLLLGVAALVMYAIPSSLIPVPAADGLLCLVLGSILVPLGIIILLISIITPRIIKTANAASGALAARAGHKAARAREKKAKAEEKTAQAEEKTAKAAENAARAEEKAARTREEGAKPEEKDKEKKNVDLAKEKIATARKDMANAQAKAAEAREDMARARQDIQGPHRWYDWLLAPALPLTVVFILVSVVFIAISAYGGMRLETKSQQSFSSQVGAIFSMDGSLATVQVDITAAKIPQSDWVFLDVYALPVKPALTGICELLYKNFTIPSNSAPCTTDPCLYFSQSKYQHIAKCTVLSNGSIVPNADGDVDETVSFPFLAAKYQYVDVRAEVCSINVCEGSVIGQNSRLDWAIPNS
jgi:hypothetical protein